MRRLLYIAFLFTTLHLQAQTGDMRVYTVAGSDTTEHLNDGGPATAAGISSTEGVWMDRICNLYFTDLGDSRIRKINTKTGIITTVAGTTHGFSGDGGLATNAQIIPYGLYVDSAGNILIADDGNNRVRRVDAVTGIITTIAGGGTSLGDGVPASGAQLNDPQEVYEDETGNIYIGEQARIRKINTSGIITTFAGNGVKGFYGDGITATNAQIYNASGMLVDGTGNFYFADRGNSVIRKIDTKGIITTFAGTPGVFDYSGDGGLATAAKLSGPISFVIDIYGNMVIGDNANNLMRKVDAKTGIITSIAGVGNSVTGSTADGVFATIADMHPEFMYLDAEGIIYYSCFCNKIRAITGYNPGLKGSGNNCGPLNIPEVTTENNNDQIGIYPNPTYGKMIIKIYKHEYASFSIENIFGQIILSEQINSDEVEVNIDKFSPGLYYVCFYGSRKNDVEKITKI